MKDMYTTYGGMEFTVSTYKHLRKYSAKSGKVVVTACNYKKLMEKMEQADLDIQQERYDT
jgi:hypothetical protein